MLLTVTPVSVTHHKILFSSHHQILYPIFQKLHLIESGTLVLKLSKHTSLIHSSSCFVDKDCPLHSAGCLVPPDSLIVLQALKRRCFLIRNGCHSVPGCLKIHHIQRNTDMHIYSSIQLDTGQCLMQTSGRLKI